VLDLEIELELGLELQMTEIVKMLSSFAPIPFLDLLSPFLFNNLDL
jgi:hypothetical protein